MNGYTSPTILDQFSIRFLNDMYSGPSDTATDNQYSASPFVGVGVRQGKLFKDSSVVAYSWEVMLADLTGAVATGNSVTVSWSSNLLNTSATNPEVQFIWGNGYAESDGTVIGSYRVGGAELPEPSTLALLGIALVGISATRRKKIVWS